MLSVVFNIFFEKKELKVVDSVDFLCDGYHCPLSVDGKALYRDGHISKYGSMFLAGRISSGFLGGNVDE